MYISIYPVHDCCWDMTSNYILLCLLIYNPAIQFVVIGWTDLKKCIFLTLQSVLYTFFFVCVFCIAFSDRQWKLCKLRTCFCQFSVQACKAFFKFGMLTFGLLNMLTFKHKAPTLCKHLHLCKQFTTPAPGLDPGQQSQVFFLSENTFLSHCHS